MTKHPISAIDVRALAVAHHAFQLAALEMAYRRSFDDHMARCKLLDLKKACEDILNRTTEQSK